MDINGDQRWLNTYRLPFNWSYSRDQVFQLCQRQYYYRYYASYGGNAPRETEQRGLILVLGKLNNTSALIGTLVHNLARDTLRAWRSGRPWDDATTLASGRALLTRELRQSERAVQRGSVNLKQRILQNHYFGGLVDREQLLTRLDSYLHGLREHPLYCEALSQADRICMLDEVRRFKVSDTPVFAVPDLVLCDDGHYRVIDWKTGSSYSSRREQLSIQLGLYALYVQRTKAIVSHPIRCEVAGISDGSVIRWDADENELERIEAYVKESISRMQAALTDPALNRTVRDNLPKRTEITPGDAECTRCVFRQLCFGISPEIN